MATFHDISELERLKTFRNVLVEARRSVVNTALDMRESNQPVTPDYGSNWAGQFKTYQDQIDAIDRALADEQKLAGK